MLGERPWNCFLPEMKFYLKPEKKGKTREKLSTQVYGIQLRTRSIKFKSYQNFALIDIKFRIKEMNCNFEVLKKTLRSG